MIYAVRHTAARPEERPYSLVSDWVPPAVPQPRRLTVASDDRIAVVPVLDQTAIIRGRAA